MITIVRARFGRLAILFVLAAFMLLGAYASLKTPLYQGYDEGWHYAYVEHYALGRPLVNLNVHFVTGDPSAPYWQTHEATQPFLYYWLMGQVTGLVPRGDLMQEQLLASGAPNRMYGNFLPADDGSLGTGHALAGHLVRFLTVAMGAVMVLCGYVIARMLTQNNATALLTAVALAFNPRDILLGAQISNDMAVACAAAVSLLVATWMVVWPDKKSLFRPILLGVCAGVTLLMKYNGAAVIVAAGVAVICQAFLARRGVRWLLLHGAAVGVGVLSVTGWYLVRNIQLYGDPLAWNKVIELNGGFSQARSLADALGWLPYIVKTIFIHPAYELEPASRFMEVMPVVQLASLVGLVIAGVRNRARLSINFLRCLPMLAVVLVNLVTYVPWFLWHDATQNARFFAPSFVPHAVGLAVGLAALLPRRVLAPSVAAVSVGLGIFTAVTYVIGLARMFPFPTYLTAEETRAILSKPDVGRVLFDDGIELLDSTVVNRRPGDDQPVQLSIVWRATRPMTQSAHLMLDVRDADGKTIGALDTGNALRYSYVTRAWRTGLLVRETYDIPARSSNRQLVHILAGWRQAADDFEPIRTTRDGQLSVELGRARLGPNPPAGPAQPALATFGDTVALTGAHIMTDSIRLEWQAQRQTDRDLTIFVHGLSASGAIVAQSDEPFAFGAPFWQTGDRFEQTLLIKDLVAANVLQIGVYDAQSVVRLQGRDAAGAGLVEGAWNLVR